MTINAAYINRREAAWAKAGILFNAKPFRWAVFITCLKLQKYRCAVCGRHLAFEPAQADHDHRDREFRGCLCRRCNHRVIGGVERHGKYRNEQVTAFAIAYLHDPPADRFRLQLMRANGELK